MLRMITHKLIYKHIMKKFIYVIILLDSYWRKLWCKVEEKLNYNDIIMYMMFIHKHHDDVYK